MAMTRSCVIEDFDPPCTACTKPDDDFCAAVVVEITCCRERRAIHLVVLRKEHFQPSAMFIIGSAAAYFDEALPAGSETKHDLRAAVSIEIGDSRMRLSRRGVVLCPVDLHPSRVCIAAHGIFENLDESAAARAEAGDDFRAAVTIDVTNGRVDRAVRR